MTRKNDDNGAVCQHVWERRAVAAVWRQTARDSFELNLCVAYFELRDAICEHEKERSLYDVLTTPNSLLRSAKIAPLPRNVA